MRENKKQLTDLAEALLVKETINGDDIRRTLAGENIVTDDEQKAYHERLLPRSEKAAERKTASESAGNDKVASTLNPVPQGV